MPEIVKLLPEESMAAINNFIKQVFEVDLNKGTIDYLKKSDIHETVIAKLLAGSFEDKIKYCAFHTARYYNSKSVRIYIDSVECQTQAVLFTLYLYMVLLHGDPKDLDKVKSLNPNFEINILNILKTKNTSSEEILEIIKKRIGADRRKILEIQLEGGLEQFEYLPEKDLQINLEIIALAIRIYIETSTDEEYRRIIRKLLNDKESVRFTKGELVANPCSIFARLKLTDDMANKIRKAKTAHEENKKAIKQKETIIQIIYRINEMSNEELKEYLKIDPYLGTKIGEYKRKIGSHQKNSNLEETQKLIDKILKRIENAKQEMAKEKRQKEDEKKQNAFSKFIDIMITEEIGDFESFAQKKHKEFGYETPKEFLTYIVACKEAARRILGKEKTDTINDKLKEIRSTLFTRQWKDKLEDFFGVKDTASPRKILKKLYKMSPDELKEYVRTNRGILLELELMAQKNEYKKFTNIIKELQRRLKPISNTIINYYKEFDYPLPSLERECMLYLNDSKINSRISKFFHKYYSSQNLKPIYEPWERGTTEKLYGVVIEPSLEDSILEYLKKNNIPDNFFPDMLRTLFPPTYNGKDVIDKTLEEQALIEEIETELATLPKSK